MISRRIFAPLALLCALTATPAEAQKSKAALTAEIAANWPDNNVGQITPALLRSTVIDIVNSYYDLGGNTSALCATHQWVSSLPTLSTIACTQPAIADIGGFGTGVATALGLGINTAGGVVVPTAALGANGVIYGGGSGVSPGFTAAGTNGQLFLGVTSGPPQWGTLSGDATISNTGVLTLAPVNSNTGPFGSATQCVTVTNNAKGLTTAVSATACTPAIGSITGLGTGIATALGVNVGTPGAPVINGGALGTPSSGIATNLTGTATGLTAGNATLAASATKLATARAIGIGGSTGLTATGVNFDGTAAITPALTGTLAVANGGTNDTGTAWGAYTPTLTCASGTTTGETPTGFFKTIGKTTFVRIVLTASTTTCASPTIGLPNTSNAGVILTGRETNVNGVGFLCSTPTSASTCAILNMTTGSGPAATNGSVYMFLGVYDST